MRLYHRTTESAAVAILIGGFRDANDRYMTEQEYAGVWLADRPLDGNEGAAGDVLLAIEIALPDRVIAEFEWVEEGKPYREFLIPAALINTNATVQRSDA